MALDELGIEELRELYPPMRDKIQARLSEFRGIWEDGRDSDIQKELIFCLLTPQSRARTCWAAVMNLCEKGLLRDGVPGQVQEELVGVRFKYRKAEYICKAMEELGREGRLRATLQEFDDPYEAREWLVRNILGMGFKEASHFLRNIGLGEDLAILDRHILRNLLRLGAVHEMPSSLSRSRYLEVEARMRELSLRTAIPMGDLDLLLWYRETGEIFK
ncbi:MAG: N-glycosylase/DNA lyase [Methanotrichaceae archaeon]|nr:N-glycosylase/DNA lyase [Methanotrichaceae archaeon]